jgi:sensor c-di-GMP phosphodiesterase-like protein
MKVTAEGVERVEQAVKLRGLGCDTALGWYWTSAVDAGEMLDVLRDGIARDDRIVIPMMNRARTGSPR